MPAFSQSALNFALIASILFIIGLFSLNLRLLFFLPDDLRGFRV